MAYYTGCAKNRKQHTTKTPILQMTVKPDTIFTVSRLNQEVQATLSSTFGMLWVEGELSNFSRPASGHFYFSLKDSRAQLRCAMFKGRNRYIDFTPGDGQQVLVRGRPGLYEPRGDFQFIVEHMTLAGTGLLQQKFEQIKRRLQEDGWFANEIKQPLPLAPRSIGIVTSPTGAALQDVLNVLKRRYPVASVIVYPTPVQGIKAAPGIIRAIQRANSRNEVDVLLVCRGGGSLEDLWAFNEEAVAAAIHRSVLPVVSGVGHEIDFTIADMVADVRAPTPSAAAELVVPDQQETLQRLQASIALLQTGIKRVTQPGAALLQQLSRRLEARHPAQVINTRIQRVDELEKHLTLMMRSQLNDYQHITQSATAALQTHSPATRIRSEHVRVAHAHGKLAASVSALIKAKRSRLENSAHALDAVSPLATLSRGYAVVRKQGTVVSDAADLAPGQQIEGLLGHGKFTAEVLDTDTGVSEPRSEG